MALSRMELFERRRGDMKREHETFVDQYKSLSEFVKPRRGRFEKEDVNKGDRRWNNIINGAATDAHAVAQAGLFNGVMGPARPWYGLGTPDPDLNDFEPVREWLFRVRDLLLAILADGNMYAQAPTTLGDELLFATGCILHVDDPQDVARFYTLPTGSYYLAQNDRSVVDTFATEVMMTVESIVTMFSDSRDKVNPAISQAVRDAYDRGNYYHRHPVVRFIAPNEKQVRDSDLAVNKPFVSLHYEPGRANTNEETFLRQSGFDEFPVHAPRWEVTAPEDVYGINCPGMRALGDVRQLQLEERRKAQGIDKMVSPLLQGPPGLRNVPFANMPGGTVIFDAGGNRQKIEPAYEVRLPIGELQKDIEGVVMRIDRAFARDLFQAISSMEGVQPRNQLELMQRHQERLMQLGPMLENTHGEFLDPMIVRLYNQAVRKGLIPDPPPELVESGQPIQVRYISMLAMAQQAVTTGNIDRILALAGTMAGIPGLERGVRKLNAEQIIDEYAQLTGVPPRLLVPDDVLAQQDEMERQMAMLQQATQLGDQAAGAFNKVGSIPLKDDETIASRVSEKLDGRMNLDGVPSNS